MPKGIYKKKICQTTKIPNFKPTEHQVLIKDYLVNSSFKGLLLYHQLGSGKTCTSIITADNMLKSKSIDHVYICTPGSLRTNWLYEYCNTCGIGSDNLRENYTFITYNYDISEQLSTVDFNNSLVIVDEFHNVINGVKNKSNTFVSLYDKIYESNCRILLLSGTPLIKDPVEEWDLILKLLDPSSYINKKTIPELKGLVSFFETNSDFYPPIYYKDPIKTNMTATQQFLFRRALKYEAMKQGDGPPKRESYDTLEEFKNANSIYILCMKHFFSRRISNFYYPDEIKNNPDVLNNETSSELPSIEVQQAAEEVIKQIINENPGTDAQTFIGPFPKPKPKPLVGWVSTQTLSEQKLLKKYSPKFTSLLINILKNQGTKHVIYSIFKIKSGVILLHTLLNKCGIKADIFSGDLNDGERTRLLKKFNSPDNRNGEQLPVILITEAGEQGITLLETNNVHILESSANNYKIQQAIGRAARFKSHTNLPPERNYVNVWRYWSQLVNPANGEVWPGIDEKLFERAKAKQDYIDKFSQDLKDISI